VNKEGGAVKKRGEKRKPVTKVTDLQDRESPRKGKNSEEEETSGAKNGEKKKNYHRSGRRKLKVIVSLAEQ